MFQLEWWFAHINNSTSRWANDESHTCRTNIITLHFFRLNSGLWILADETGYPGFRRNCIWFTFGWIFTIINMIMMMYNKCTLFRSRCYPFVIQFDNEQLQTRVGPPKKELYEGNDGAQEKWDIFGMIQRIRQRYLVTWFAMSYKRYNRDILWECDMKIFSLWNTCDMLFFPTGNVVFQLPTIRVLIRRNSYSNRI